MSDADSIFEPLPLAYVAGPYTRPDPVLNTRDAGLAADQVLKLGAVALVPHLSLLHHAISPRPYEDWIRIAMQMLSRCDVVLRIPGESPGADREVALARELRLTVVTSLAGLEAWLRGRADAIEEVTRVG